ncbi:MAG TPA: protein-methionine-sulfoxide reductase catalytic subunit MsrP [Anaerolineales bacterium]|nr:protein-methionine-sulfoxide reductase catalytic subunit MsrP [Anaerolineales bacterium]
MDRTHRSMPVLSSEITSESVYRRRRDFLKAAGALGGGALLAACAPSVATPQAAPSSAAGFDGSADELGAPLNSFQDITNYNNYYEFSTSKEAVAPLSVGFKSEPWSVEVTGLVSRPQTFAMEDLLKMFPQEDRIYRLRCVEAWSMVIPWQGFPLASLLKAVEPLMDAKYVAFTSLHDPAQFPGQANSLYPWPYGEGLRLDEAMNDLTLMVTGLYGAALTPQNGAPLRLAVPWKYGFKSLKAIVKIELVAEQPETFWKAIASNEYGFYANVNPDVAHPRWAQSSERRIGELSRRPTLLFNGYADQVAELYKGMDLAQNY